MLNKAMSKSNKLLLRNINFKSSLIYRVVSRKLQTKLRIQNSKSAEHGGLGGGGLSSPTPLFLKNNFNTSID